MMDSICRADTFKSVPGYIVLTPYKAVVTARPDEQQVSARKTRGGTRF